MSETTWTPYSWQAPDKVLAQVPEYPDPEALERVERQLKRVRVRPKHKIEVLLCLQRRGVPNENARLVLEYLV